jgi:hypothetical protein
MNDVVATELIKDELQRLRLLNYSELVRLIGEDQISTPLGSDGKEYQMEVDVFWDEEKGGDVRVIVAVDDGGLRAFVPLTSDFIMRSDGTLVE